MGLQQSSLSSPLLAALARQESFPSGIFPWVLQNLTALLIMFSLGWQNTNQLSHASASCRHNAAERELGLSGDTKRRCPVLMPGLPRLLVDLPHTSQVYHQQTLA